MTAPIGNLPRYARARLESLTERERNAELILLGEELSRYILGPAAGAFEELLANVVRALATQGHHLEEYDYDGRTHFYARNRKISENSDLCFRASQEDGVVVGWDDWTPTDD